jgi:hypothetical protein
MITRKPLKRKTPLKRNANPLKQKHKIAPVSKKRYQGLYRYRIARQKFLEAHPICPITGEATTEIHHSARREVNWLLLERYWIALSQKGHAYTHQHTRWARANGLIVDIHTDYDTHVSILNNYGESLTDPVFYQGWDGQLISRDEN